MNTVPEMVIVTAPKLPKAEMAPPYKVDVPPPDVEHREPVIKRVLRNQK